jgi:hypothetical protein
MFSYRMFDLTFDQMLFPCSFDFGEQSDSFRYFTNTRRTFSQGNQEILGAEVQLPFCRRK